jgi:dolichol-phosphate mannosyltransferase
MHFPARRADNVLYVPEPQISIVVPALNEAANLTPLTEQIAAALAGREFEILIVDDNSQDDTPAVGAQLAQRFPLKLIVRKEPKDGLSGAVLRGFSEARGEYLIVMDADLQHPPAKLPELLAPLEKGEADFVMGSRYVPGGSTAEHWGLFRKINSDVATFLARPFAGSVTDPMSGFFALKRSTYERAQRLTPLGYKIGLELMCKARVQKVREIPIHFAERTRGESKLSLKQQFKYLEHLSRLYDFTFPRASPMAKFAIVLAASWLTALWTFAVLRKATSLGPIGATIWSYVAAVVMTAIFHLRYVNTQREFLVRRHPWLDFLFISAAELVTCALVVMWVWSRVEMPSMWDYLLIPFGCATALRYVLRKELLQDVRGLRKELRADEWT